MDSQEKKKKKKRVQEEETMSNLKNRIHSILFYLFRCHSKFASQNFVMFMVHLIVNKTVIKIFQ